MPRHLVTAVSALLVAALVPTLAGCTPTAPDNAGDGVVRIVASTNVYGDLAAMIAGSNAEVTSVIDDPTSDPHGFEGNGRVQLAISRADVVVINGGGYDDFVTSMLAASGNTDATVVTAVEVSGHTELGANEHVWFDYAAMIALTFAVEEALGDVDPDNSEEFAANATTLAGEIEQLGVAADDALPAVDGAGIIVTEPLPLYLLDRMGFDDLTPPEFSAAIEEGTDASPAVLREVLSRIADGSVALVVYNEQTGGAQTDAVVAAAAESGVPAIPVTETLPAGLHYVDWQRALQRAILAGLDG